VRGSVMKLKIDEIIVKNRIRADSGNLTPLKESMNRSGLLNPVSITKDKILLAGFRRLESARQLGWEEIECRIVNAVTPIEKFNVEVEENLTRKQFDESELIKIEEERRYLFSSGFERVILWMIRFFRRILTWLDKKFRKKNN